MKNWKNTWISFSVQMKKEVIFLKIFQITLRYK